LVCCTRKNLAAPSVRCWRNDLKSDKSAFSVP
jgi:hypothetical protein